VSTSIGNARLVVSNALERSCPKMKREPVMRKRKWERKIRHASRDRKAQGIPTVKEGKLLGRIGDEIQSRNSVSCAHSDL
jgi:hypothetical protein